MDLKLYFIFLILIKSSLSFVSFPFIASDLLDGFLGSLDVDQIDVDYKQDLMKNAVMGEECYRPCKKNNRKICYFHWTVESYQAMGGACNNCSKGTEEDCFHPQCVTADGVERGIMSINRQVPGPPINVCKDDLVIVDVHNDMDGSGTSIHWHGMNQKETPYMDGVPYLTQCPIQYSSTFRYSFHVREAGTNFYHSHSGLQKANGMFGSLVIRAPERQDPNERLYNYDLPEHTIVVSNWLHDYAETYLPGLPSSLKLYESLIFDGRGRYLNLETKEYTFAPLSFYRMNAGNKYRFRLINSASNICAFLFQIENHTLTMIATDSENVKPHLVDSFYFLPGERYDFIVEANQSPRDYWIRMRALWPCTNNVEAFAVLSYNTNTTAVQHPNAGFTNKTPPIFEDRFPKGDLLNTPKPVLFNLTDIPIVALESFQSDKQLIHAKPDTKKFLFFGTPKIQNEILFSGENHYKYFTTSTTKNVNGVGALNNISLTYPTFPLLTQPDQIDENMFCDENYKPQGTCNNESNVCFCIHRLKVKLNSIVELILVDISDINTHPFHLHGHKFVVMNMGMFNKTMTPAEVRKELPEGSVFHKNQSPPYKDTILVPNPGYVRIRFRADNPGFWLVHCHIEWHLAVGMGMILQVGEINEMKKPPKNFPTCNNYKPNDIQ